MFRGPRLKSAPFAPFSRSFLPESVMRKAGFVKNNDCPYERNTATKTTHQEFYKVMIDSMFGAPSPKILRLDTLYERFVISQTEKGRGRFVPFSTIKGVKQDIENPSRAIIIPMNPRERETSFTLESPEIAKTFCQRFDKIIKDYREHQKS